MSANERTKDLDNPINNSKAFGVLVLLTLMFFLISMLSMFLAGGNPKYNSSSDYRITTYKKIPYSTERKIIDTEVKSGYRLNMDILADAELGETVFKISGYLTLGFLAVTIVFALYLQYIKPKMSKQ